jgi:hypothetical protein
MAKKITGLWSMRHDRELIALSKTHTLEALVEQLQRPPKSILDKGEEAGAHDQRKAK